MGRNPPLCSVKAILRGVFVCWILCVVSAPSYGGDSHAYNEEWQWVRFGVESGLSPGRVFDTVKIKSRYPDNEGQWLRWNSTHNAVLTSPPCGDCVIKVHAKSLLDNVDVEAGTVSFSVPASFYRRPLLVGGAAVWLAGMAGLVAMLWRRDRRRQQQLRESEKRFRMLADRVPAVFSYLSPDLHYQFVNRQYKTMFGLDPEQVQGKHVREVLGEQSFAAVRHHLDRALAGQAVHWEQQLPEHLGGPRWCEGQFVPDLDSHGQVKGLFVLIHDVTARRQAEAALRESESRLRSLFDTSLDAIVETTRDGAFVSANAAAHSLFGYAADELMNIHASQLYADADERRIAQLELEERGAIQGAERRLRRKDGTEFVATISSNVRRDTNGGILGYQAIIRDMTQHRQLEKQLRQTQKMEAIGQFAAGVAHEFNNLMTAILVNAEMMLAMTAVTADGGRDESLAKGLEQVKIAGQRAATLTRQLLAFSRYERPKMELVDFRRIVHDAEEMLRRLLREDIVFEVNVAPDIRRIRAGAGQLEQVIMNLVLNAADAMPEGGRLRVECVNIDLDETHASSHIDAKLGPHVELSVADTGSGMSPSTMEHLFEPFFTTKPIGKGTGLGLSTVYAHVAKCGGHITVESRIDEGTVFRVYFPQAEGDAAILNAGSESAEPDLLAGNETIMVCDDAEVVLNSLSELLKSAGYRVLSAGSGHQALELSAAHNGPIHLLLTDVIMPELRGPEVAKKLRQRHPELKVIYMSGYPSDLLDADENGSADFEFVQKPPDVESLFRRVRDLLDKTPSAST